MNDATEETSEFNGAEPLKCHERDAYIKLFEIHNANRIDYNVRKWETVKFFQAIFTAFLFATVAAIVAASDKGLMQHFEFRFVVAIFPIAGGISLLFGLRNLHRESRLLFLEEAQMFKLARILKLDKSSSEIAFDGCLGMNTFCRPNGESINTEQIIFQTPRILNSGLKKERINTHFSGSSGGFVACK